MIYFHPFVASHIKQRKKPMNDEDKELLSSAIEDEVQNIWEDGFVIGSIFGTISAYLIIQVVQSFFS
jgi:hypothetical protein